VLPGAGVSCDIERALLVESEKTVIAGAAGGKSGKLQWHLPELDCSRESSQGLFVS
jgi:hypothetical protein